MCCRHCYVKSSHDDNVSMEFEEILNILKEAYELGILIFFMTGGEVFEHPNLLDIIDYAYPKFHSLTLSTSGYYINECNFKLFTLIIYAII